MNTDHIIEEVRKIREAQAAKFNYDIKKIIAEAKKKEKKTKHTLISFQQRKVHSL